LIPRETIDEIYRTARIEEVIGEFVNLKKAGSNFKGLSPFTQEKTPSFMVSPAKQIYKCFSTGKGGNVVSFLMELEQYSYPEALKYLAEKYNIEIVEEKQTEEQVAQQNKRETLGAVNQFAEKFFHNNIFETDEGKAIALSYFKERGFTLETIKKFKLGYCPENEGISETAQKAGYDKKYLLELGLSKEKDGRIFDFFKGRVIFPIHSLSGRPIAFAGRTLKNDKKVAKYFNSPESELYHKSNVLYGLNLAKSTIVREDNCFLVEGYTDVISLVQSGVENVVASSGTSLTKEQIRLIKRYTPNITVLYDGDSAGIKASFRGIDLILEEGLQVKAVLFPDGEDPDSFAKNHTKEELLAYLQEKAEDFISFKVNLLLSETENDPIKKSELIRDIIKSIALIPDSITRSLFASKTAGLLSLDERMLSLEVDKIVRNKLLESGRTQRNNESLRKNKGSEQLGNIPPEVEAAHQDLQQEALKPKDVPDAQVICLFQEKEVIRVLLNYGEQIQIFPVTDENGKIRKEKKHIFKYIIEALEEDQLGFEEPTLQKIYHIYKEHYNSEKVPVLSDFTQHEDQKIASVAVDLSSEKYHLSENWEKHKIYTVVEQDPRRMLHTIQQPIFEFKQKKLELLRDRVQQELKEPADEERVMELLTLKALYDKVIGQLAGDIQGRVIIK
jgi:DNA primase